MIICLLRISIKKKDINITNNNDTNSSCGKPQTALVNNKTNKKKLTKKLSRGKPRNINGEQYETNSFCNNKMHMHL